jgi:hypothetical protein
MNRIGLLLVMALGVAGGLEASTISCSGSTATIQACMTADSIYWSDQVDWAQLGGLGTTHVTGSSWVATSANSVQVSLQSNDTIVRADNTLTSFPGRFATGDHLIENLGLNALSMSLSSPMVGAAIRLSAANGGPFGATFSAYSTAIPSGFPVATVSLMLGGGTCASLVTGSPCNDAPFIGFFNVATPFLSLVISTLDTAFYVDELFLQKSYISGPTNPTPEPIMSAMIGGGLAALALIARRRMARRC